MENREREFCCQVLAALCFPPDMEVAELVRDGGLHAFSRTVIQAAEGEKTVLEGFRMDGSVQAILRDLEKSYRWLFSGLEGKKIPLVESCYKPWTRDLQCTVPFASEKGLLMGDSALHLREIYRCCGLEVFEELKNTPDHVGLELQFLSCLYHGGTDDQIRTFIRDHLDWLDSLRLELDRAGAPLFYKGLFDLIALFIDRERKRLEGEANGEKEGDSRDSVSDGPGRDAPLSRLLEN
jgi:putative dimethyl sulfoxide reductase chaperone